MSKKGNVSKDLALHLIRTLACGLYELHRASEGIDNPLPRIAHRDLKPANVLISDKHEAIICDFNSAIPLIRELPHQCECFNRQKEASDRPIGTVHRPFEPQLLLQSFQHDRPGCSNRKILEKIEEVRERCFHEKCLDGTWLYMAPEILSLSMFETGDMDISYEDIVNRYCSADIYSFSLIAWLVLCHCDELRPRKCPQQKSIDDFLFEEFLQQGSTRAKSLPTRTVSEKEQLMHCLLNEENIRPICGSDPIFELIQECWAPEGACRPDARQLYNKLREM